MPTQLYLESLINQTNELSDSMKKEEDYWLQPYLLVTRAINWISTLEKPPEDAKQETQFAISLYLAFELTNSQEEEKLLLYQFLQFIGAVSRGSRLPISKVCYDLIKELMTKEGFLEALEVVSFPNDSSEKSSVNLTDLIVSVYNRDD